MPSPSSTSCASDVSVTMGMLSPCPSLLSYNTKICSMKDKRYCNPEIIRNLNNVEISWNTFHGMEIVKQYCQKGELFEGKIFPYTCISTSIIPSAPCKGEIFWYTFHGIKTVKQQSQAGELLECKICPYTRISTSILGISGR